MREKYKVLILCTGNSARSIMAEVILNDLGEGRFAAFSAGSRPAGEVNPAAIRQLLQEGHDISGLRSKSWDEFATADAPKLDYVITVCDSVAAEICPVWAGKPLRLHWSIDDPAKVPGSAEEVAAAFCRAYKTLQQRIADFVKAESADLQ